MAARDNLLSTRSRDDIDHDAAVRTEVQDLRLELLYGQDPQKFREVQAWMAARALDQRTPIRTAVVAGAAYMKSVVGLIQSSPVVNVQQGISLTASDLLRLIPASRGQVPSVVVCPFRPPRTPVSYLTTPIRRISGRISPESRRRLPFKRVGPAARSGSVDTS